MPDMSPDLERLIQLQQLDLAIADARRQIASHPDRLQAADARLSEARATLDTATQQLKDSHDARRALEKDATLFQSRLSKFKDQLSDVKTNREYQAMQKEIDVAQGELRAVEDKVLERMMEADALAAAVKTAEARLTTEQKEVEAEKRALAQELTRTEQALQEASVRRESLVRDIEPRLIALFEQVAKARKGIGVCPARDGLCSLCHVRLRPHVYQQVRHNDTIIQCDSCQRILYFAPPPASAEPPTTHAS